MGDGDARKQTGFKNAGSFRLPRPGYIPLSIQTMSVKEKASKEDLESPAVPAQATAFDDVFGEISENGPNYRNVSIPAKTLEACSC